MNIKPSRLLPLILPIGLVLLLIYTPDAPSHPYYDNISRPLVIAHQGGDGVWPGDTMYAFEMAVEIGADVLEMDAHITQDGQIVLMHDETVDDTTEGTGLIEDMTLAELKQLDAAYK
jgi:glycerophosphoryl diester phosphodiesterase